MVSPVAIEILLERVHTLLDRGETGTVIDILRRLHPADSSEILFLIPPDAQNLILQELPWEEVADVLEELDQEEMVEVVHSLTVAELADVLDEMEPDMAADLIGQLDNETAAELLDEMEAAAGVTPLLAYPEDSAGGIMNSPRHMLHRHMTADQAMQFLREQYDDEHDLYYLYVLDGGEPYVPEAGLRTVADQGRLVGIVSLQTLILADPAVRLEEIMDPEVLTAHVDADQEEVARILTRYNLLAVPVVNEEDRLLGIVTVDDVVDVLEQEATEDIYRLAQVSEEAVIFSPLPRAVRARLPWLVVNLGTALISSTVVAQFAGTIAAVAILAALMPVVAAQGGNAGNQAMTIIVRSLAAGPDRFEGLLGCIPARARRRPSAWPGTRCAGGCRHLRLARQPDPERGDRHGDGGEFPGGGGGGRSRPHDPAPGRSRPCLRLKHDGDGVYRYPGVYAVSGIGQLSCCLAGLNRRMGNPFDLAQLLHRL